MEVVGGSNGLGQGSESLSMTAMRPKRLRHNLLIIPICVIEVS